MRNAAGRGQRLTDMPGRDAEPAYRLGLTTLFSRPT
jgi:hypothetical protein